MHVQRIWLPRTADLYTVYEQVKYLLTGHVESHAKRIWLDDSMQLHAEKRPGQHILDALQQWQAGTASDASSDQASVQKRINDLTLQVAPSRK